MEVNIRLKAQSSFTNVGCPSDAAVEDVVAGGGLCSGVVKLRGARTNYRVVHGVGVVDDLDVDDDAEALDAGGAADDVEVLDAGGANNELGVLDVRGVAGLDIRGDARGVNDVQDVEPEGEGCFRLISVVQGDPTLFTYSRRRYRGESSTRRDFATLNGASTTRDKSRLLTPYLSNTLNDSNIFNCNRRLRSEENGMEELRLWGIAKDIGVVCQESEESILQKFFIFTCIVVDVCFKNCDVSVE